MQCPDCKAMDSKVIDSRLAGEGQQIRRRRECIHCHERFTTYETIELSLPRLHKKDGSYVEFDETKLRTGLIKAFEKRPVSLATIDEITTKIIRHLRSCGERELSTERLGEWVMEEIKAVDQIAYVRFASVYRQFQDVEEFNQEIRKLKEKTCPELEDLA